MATLDYAKAGVDRDAADRLAQKIGRLARGTIRAHGDRVKSSVGGYASLFALDSRRWLAASTDGVGTKLKLAFELGTHDTVGIDLVAMSVNDLLCVGAEPLFFLDYFATGKLDPRVGEAVIRGVVEGCRQARCALVGGETAEMPDLYAKGEYDLAGFAVGHVDRARALPRPRLRPGLALVGVASSGMHSNGFSLLRRLLDRERLSPAARRRRARELLTPTRIYVDALRTGLARGTYAGLAHITGSGFLNVPRISTDVAYSIELPPPSELPPIFDWARRTSRLPFAELAQTFNLGLGLVIAVDPGRADAVVRDLKRAGERAWIVGQTIPRPRGKAGTTGVSLRQGRDAAWLAY